VKIVKIAKTKKVKKTELAKLRAERRSTWRPRAWRALVAALDQYIEVLGKELAMVATLASVHGWRSTRVQQGIDMRKQLAKLRRAAERECS